MPIDKDTQGRWDREDGKATFENRYPVMRAFVGDRRSGKSTQLLWWVLDGKKASGYPGWTRVLVTPSMQMAEVTKRMAVELRPDTTWGDLDLAHRIYSLHEWENAHGVRDETKVAFDNVEFMLPKVPGRVTALSMTGIAYHLPDPAP
jgi:hypothetical protein